MGIIHSKGAGPTGRNRQDGDNRAGEQDAWKVEQPELDADQIDGHAISERANLLAHREIVTIVNRASEILEAAAKRIDETIAMTGGTAGERLWQTLLKEPWSEVRERMVRDDHEGRLLRSNTPFPFVIGLFEENERRRWWKQAKSELSQESQFKIGDD